VEARAAVADQRAPQAVLVDGRLTQHLVDQRRGVQVVVGFDWLAPRRHLARADQFQTHRQKQVVLGGGREKFACSPCFLPRSAALVRARLCQLPFPPAFVRRDEPALGASVILLHFSLAD